MSEAHTDLEAFGAPPEIVELARAQNTQKTFEVWPENWQTLEIFTRMMTQWKSGPMGGFIGMDYSALPFMFKLYLVEDQKECFESIQVMELAALEVFNEKRD